MRDLKVKPFLKWAGGKNQLLADIRLKYPNPEDYPNPSYLVFGITLNSRILHVVCDTDGETLWIITAYIPDNIKWENDYKTRRKEN